MADYEPKHPTMQVYNHILEKGFQAGSIIGTGAVIPATAAYTTWYRKSSVGSLQWQLVRAAGISALVGTTLTGLLGVVKLSQIDSDGMRDRAYRLHYNHSQHRTDLFALVGSALGLAAGVPALRRARHTTAVGTLHFVGLTALGTAGGVLLHLLTRPEDHKTPDKMMHELKAT